MIVSNIISLLFLLIFFVLVLKVVYSFLLFYCFRTLQRSSLASSAKSIDVIREEEVTHHQNSRMAQPLA